MKTTQHAWFFPFMVVVLLATSHPAQAQVAVESGYVCSVSLFPSNYVSSHGKSGYILFETNSAAKCAGYSMSKFMVLTSGAVDTPINSALLHSRDDLAHLYEQLIALARSGSPAYFNYEADTPIWGVFRQFGWLSVYANP